MSREDEEKRTGIEPLEIEHVAPEHQPTRRELCCATAKNIFLDLTKFAATILLGIGSLTITAGGMVFAISDLFAFLNFSNSILLNLARALAIISATYVACFTRLYSVWRLFSEAKTMVTEIIAGIRESNWGKRIFGGALFLTSIAATEVTIGSRALFGTYSILEFMGLTNPLAMGIIAFYMTLTAIIASLAFMGKIGLQTIFCNNYQTPKSTKNWGALIFIEILAMIRSIAQTLLMGYILSEGAEYSAPLRAAIPNRTIRDVASFGVSTVTAFACSQARAVRVYNDFAKTHKGNLKSYGCSFFNPVKTAFKNCCCNTIKLVSLLFNSFVSSLYAIVFLLTTFASLAKAEKYFTEENNSWYLYTPNIIFSVAATLIEIAFMIQIVNRNSSNILVKTLNCGNKNDPEQTPLLGNSNTSTLS